jgi:hypothetical protein
MVFGWLYNADACGNRNIDIPVCAPSGHVVRCLSAVKNPLGTPLNAYVPIAAARSLRTAGIADPG